MSKLAKLAMTAVIVASAVGAWAQATEPKAQQPAPAQNPAATATQAPPSRPDAAQQMRVDLDQMESLLNNMATQTSFIRDTNMSILLNTNVRLWSILIRDLRSLVDAQQGVKQAAPVSSPRP